MLGLQGGRAEGFLAALLGSHTQVSSDCGAEAGEQYSQDKYSEKALAKDLS